MLQQSTSISTETIVRVFLVAALCAVAYEVRGLLLLFFISLILATILHPIAGWGERHRIPRSVTIGAVYLLGAAAIVGIGFALVPLFVEQITQISQNFSGHWDRIVKILPPEVNVSLKNAIQQNISSVADAAKGGALSMLNGLLSTVQGVFGALGSLVIVIVLTFYMVVEQHSMRKVVAGFIPPRHIPLAERIVYNVERNLGKWARGQLILSLIIGILVYISLIIIGVPYALSLAVLAFMLEFIPYTGPTLAGFFGVFFAFTVSPTVALITAIAYYVIQVLENHLIVPKVMEKAAGISPILSIISILLCFKLLGILGIFVGIPIAAMVVAFSESYNEMGYSL